MPLYVQYIYVRVCSDIWRVYPYAHAQGGSGGSPLRVPVPKYVPVQYVVGDKVWFECRWVYIHTLRSERGVGKVLSTMVGVRKHWPALLNLTQPNPPLTGGGGTV